MNADLSRCAWEKSTYSEGTGGECVEFSRDLVPVGAVPVRDSKNPQAPALLVSTAAWAAFVASVRG